MPLTVAVLADDKDCVDSDLVPAAAQALAYVVVQLKSKLRCALAVDPACTVVPVRRSKVTKTQFGQHY